MIKPMLASDWKVGKVRFPVMMQPKIDGVRGLNLEGQLTGRSLKQHENLYVTKFFSKPEYRGLDGELAAALETDPLLCTTTSSAVSTIRGEPYVLWWLFDYIVPATRALPYRLRYDALFRYYRDNPALERLRLMPCRMVHTAQEIEDTDAEYLDAGYEGSILRDPEGLYKEGRSTVREGGLLRIKRLIEEDAMVVAIVEGRKNNNVAITNELGNTSRSTHAENMEPNGRVGALQCIDVKTGKDITVGAGSMPHALRLHYFNNPQLIMGKVIKYKSFPIGVKDKPRFPTFQSLRAKSDIV